MGAVCNCAGSRERTPTVREHHFQRWVACQSVCKRSHPNVTETAVCTQRQRKR